MSVPILFYNDAVLLIFQKVTESEYPEGTPISESSTPPSSHEAIYHGRVQPERRIGEGWVTSIFHGELGKSSNFKMCFLVAFKLSDRVLFAHTKPSVGDLELVLQQVRQKRRGQVIESVAVLYNTGPYYYAGGDKDRDEEIKLLRTELLDVLEREGVIAGGVEPVLLPVIRGGLDDRDFDVVFDDRQVSIWNSATGKFDELIYLPFKPLKPTALGRIKNMRKQLRLKR